MARTGLLVTRSAVAAGPISSAVESTAPIATAASETEIASAARYAMPTILTCTPLARARSADSEVRRRTRASTATVTRATMPDAMSAGTVSGLITKMEPNKTVNEAPVVEVCWVPR